MDTPNLSKLSVKDLHALVKESIQSFETERLADLEKKSSGDIRSCESHSLNLSRQASSLSRVDIPRQIVDLEKLFADDNYVKSPRKFSKSQDSTREASESRVPPHARSPRMPLIGDLSLSTVLQQSVPTYAEYCSSPASRVASSIEDEELWKTLSENFARRIPKSGGQKDENMSRTSPAKVQTLPRTSPNISKLSQLNVNASGRKLDKAKLKSDRGSKKKGLYTNALLSQSKKLGPASVVSSLDFKQKWDKMGNNYKERFQFLKTAYPKKEVFDADYIPLVWKDMILTLNQFGNNVEDFCFVVDVLFRLRESVYLELALQYMTQRDKWNFRVLFNRLWKTFAGNRNSLRDLGVTDNVFNQIKDQYAVALLDIVS